MKTLIIVDAQNDFMPGGALEVHGGDQIVPVINQMQQKFDLIVATQDWHPAGHKSFVNNHPGKREFETIKLNGLDQKLWPPHCIQGTPGAQFHPELKTDAVEAIFRKGMEEGIDSYSGFYDNGHRKSTGLAGYLREKGCKELYFCGLAADICVYFSLLDALKEGFEAFLVENAAIPLDLNHYDQIKLQIKEKGGKVITSEEI